MKPLAGLKILELARILAGPWAGQVLADLGATVIKIESPNGDDTGHRSWTLTPARSPQKNLCDYTAIGRRIYQELKVERS